MISKTWGAIAELDMLEMEFLERPHATSKDAARSGVADTLLASWAGFNVCPNIPSSESPQPSAQPQTSIICSLVKTESYAEAARPA